MLGDFVGSPVVGVRLGDVLGSLVGSPVVGSRLGDVLGSLVGEMEGVLVGS